MSLVVERKRLEQEDGEPLQTVRITPDFDAADQCRGCGVLVVAGEWGLTADNEARFLKPLVDFGYFVVGIDLVRLLVQPPRRLVLAELFELDRQDRPQLG